MRNKLLASVLVTVAGFFLLADANIFAQGAPRTADGKPNFSGLWGGTGAAPVNAPTARASDITRTRRQQGLADLPLSDWGRQVFMYYTAGDGKYQGETGGVGDPRYHNGVCGGPRSPADLGNAMQIFQSPELLQITYETTQPWVRKIWIGREHPKDLGEYVPLWMGHSIARWEGDILVVDTVQIKTWEGSAISSARAIPHSNKLHMIERFQLTPDGKIRIDTTYDDPVTYTKPWSQTRMINRRTDYKEMAFSWELEEGHEACDPTGGFWKEDDPWFDKYDQVKGEVIADLDTLKKGLPKMPASAAQAQPFLGTFGQPKK
jgi:hypothetical protein